MARKRKERNITEKWSGNGHYLVIRIRNKNVNFSRTINFADYGNNEKAVWKEAAEIRDAVLFDIQKGLSVDTKRTVKYLYDRIFEWESLSVETKRKYDMLYNNYITEYGNTIITKIEMKHIQKEVNQCARSSSHEWAGRLKTVWNKIYITAKKEGIRIDNPTDAITVPAGQFKPKRKNAISDKDYEIFMDYLWQYGQNEQELYRSRAIFYANLVMRYTGLRPQECYSLSRKDFDLVGNVITIDKSLSSAGEIKQTKTKSSVREIPISSALKEELTEILTWSRNDLLFADYYGKPIKTKDRATLIGHVTKQCKIYFSEYMSRHRFATELIRAGIPLAEVRDLMGHKGADMTIYYTVSNEETRRQAVEVLARKEGVYAEKSNQTRKS